MAATYFTPEENTLYSICFQNDGVWWETYASPDNKIYGRQSLNEPSNDALWQFFKVAENSYAIANYGYGTIWNISSGDDYSYISLGKLGKESPIITPFVTNSGGDDGDSVQMTVSTVDVIGTVHADADLTDFVRVDSSSDFSFAVKSIKPNSANSSLSETQQGLEINEPTFENGSAPRIYPATPAVMNEVYVPYFMVNDPTMSSLANRIQKTPYYILRQFGQYEMVAEYRNGSKGTVTFVETWEYGWSATVSANMSAQLGFELGGTIEENELVLKETEQITVKANLGIELGASFGVSGTFSKEIRAEAPANTAIAIYGITATFELCQGDGTSAVASPNVPMKTNRRFVSISEPYPNTKS